MVQLWLKSFMIIKMKTFTKECKIIWWMSFIDGKHWVNLQKGNIVTPKQNHFLHYYTDCQDENCCLFNKFPPQAIMVKSMQS